MYLAALSLNSLCYSPYFPRSVGGLDVEEQGRW